MKQIICWDQIETWSLGTSNSETIWVQNTNFNFDPCEKLTIVWHPHAQANPDPDHLEGCSSDEEVDGCKADLDEKRHQDSEDKQTIQDAPKDGGNKDDDDGPKAREPWVYIGMCKSFSS